MTCVLILVPTQARTFVVSDGSGWAMFPYIVKMVYEAYKRYAQLQMMISQGQASMEYLRYINSGLDDIIGIMATLPVKDEKILEDLKNFQKALEKIDTIYGKIPKSSESAMQLLHDQTIAESFKVTNNVKDYAANQEQNASQALQLAQDASPKGAIRLAASMQAQTLHAVTQLLKVNGQILKLQSEEFAMVNKESKDSVRHFNKLNTDFRKSINGFSGDFSLPKF